MSDRTYMSLLNGWTFKSSDAGSPPPPGGLVLRDVRHDGHNFAKSLRLVGIWVTVEEVDPPNSVTRSWKMFVSLDAMTFQVSQTDLILPTPVTWHWPGGRLYDLKGAEAALEFGDYLTQGDGGNGFGISAKYDAPALFAATANCQQAGLTVEQIFLFSRYSDSPRHEPSGGLKAARCFPLTRYQLSENSQCDKSKKYSRVAAIRFDYRLHLYLDAHYDQATNALIQQKGNQAGFFADSDSALVTMGRSAVSVAKTTAEAALKAMFSSMVWMGSGSSPASGTFVSAGAFDAAEKPLVLEVTGPGLAGGYPVFRTQTESGKDVTVRCWDNVHWWGARGPGQPLVSTPGAFHCAHLHWRWGGAVKGTPTAAPIAFMDHFNPNTYPRDMRVPSGNDGMWGPLVDPAIFLQNIRVAVTRNTKDIDPDKGAAAAAMSTEDWKTAFTSKNAPQSIEAGDDLVLWFSTEVLHAKEVLLELGPDEFVPGVFAPSNGGTIFIHGIFFAHDAELEGFTVGSTDPLYVPTSAEDIRKGGQWFRAAQIK
jgi:hypothetical protein